MTEFTNWDAATISSLTEVKWPALKQLSLRDRGSWGQTLDARSIANLSKAHWPVMQSMYLDPMPSVVASLRPLLNATWPRLKVFKFRSDLLPLICSHKLPRTSGLGALWGKEILNFGRKLYNRCSQCMCDIGFQNKCLNRVRSSFFCSQHTVTTRASRHGY